MGLFDTLKSAVFEDDSSSKPAPVQQPTPPATTQTIAPPNNSVYTPPTSYIDEDTLKALRKVAYDRQTPFKTLLESMDKMKDIIPNEETRAKAAFANIASDARTPQHIITAISVHLNDLEGERARFNNLASSKKSSLISSLDMAVSTTTSALERTAAEIEALEASIADKRKAYYSLQESLTKTNAERAGVDATFETASQNFLVAFDHVRNELESKRNIFTTIFN